VRAGAEGIGYRQGKFKNQWSRFVLDTAERKPGMFGDEDLEALLDRSPVPVDRNQR